MFFFCFFLSSSSQTHRHTDTPAPPAVSNLQAFWRPQRQVGAESPTGKLNRVKYSQPSFSAGPAISTSVLYPISILLAHAIKPRIPRTPLCSPFQLSLNQSPSVHPILSPTTRLHFTNTFLRTSLFFHCVSFPFLPTSTADLIFFYCVNIDCSNSNTHAETCSTLCHRPAEPTKKELHD